MPDRAINAIELAMEVVRAVQTRFYRDFPSHPAAHLNLGLVHAATERCSKSKRSLSRAVNLNPLDPRAWYNRALACWKLGRREECRSDLEQALRLSPQMPEASKLLHQIMSDRH